MHPAVQRFTDSLGKKPYCSQNSTASLIRSREQAIKYDYVSLNRRRVAYLAFDIDREGSAFAYYDSNLPPPTLTMINPENAHVHMLYELTAPVAITNNSRKAPIKYLADVEARMTDELNADTAFSGLMIKNPLSNRWNTIANDATYDLGLLLEYLPDRKPRKLIESVGWGRNCMLFDELRKWAYPRITSAKTAGLDSWHYACLKQAENLNKFNVPLPFSEIRSISKSVAKWTWNTYTGSAQAGRVITAVSILSLKHDLPVKDLLCLMPGLVAKAANVSDRTLRHLRNAGQV